MPNEWLNLLNGLTLLGIPLVALIPVLVGMLRAWGLSERWTGPAAAILGVIGMLLVQLIDAYPDLGPWVRIPVFGLLLGLGANGAYSQFKMWKDKLNADPPTTGEILDRYNLPDPDAPVVAPVAKVKYKVGDRVSIPDWTNTGPYLIEEVSSVGATLGTDNATLIYKAGDVWWNSEDLVLDAEQGDS